MIAILLALALQEPVTQPAPTEPDFIVQMQAVVDGPTKLSPYTLGVYKGTRGGKWVLIGPEGPIALPSNKVNSLSIYQAGNDLVLTGKPGTYQLLHFSSSMLGESTISATTITIGGSPVPPGPNPNPSPNPNPNPQPTPDQPSVYGLREIIEANSGSLTPAAKAKAPAIVEALNGVAGQIRAGGLSSSMAIGLAMTKGLNAAMGDQKRAWAVITDPVQKQMKSGGKITNPSTFAEALDELAVAIGKVK